MRKFGILLAALIFSSAGFAGPIPANVGFTFTILEPQHPTGCTTTWILPNNVPPDFYYNPGQPGYNNVSSANSCFPGSVFVFSNIIFPGPEISIAFNDFAGGFWFGPLLYAQTASGISFNLGTFGLTDEFDYFHAVIDIQAAPEPATLLLVIGGFAAILCMRGSKGREKTH